MGLLTRVEGWERLLAEAVEEGRQRPFQWGVNDCATWAFDVVARLRGGPSEADAWRGRYSTEAGALRMIRKLGHADMRALIEARLGAALPAVLLAQRGDLALSDDGLGVGVVVGRAVFGMAPGAGLSAQPLTGCVLGWRV